MWWAFHSDSLEGIIAHEACLQLHSEKWIIDLEYLNMLS